MGTSTAYPTPRSRGRLGIGTYTWAELQAAYPNNGAALLALPANTMAFVSDWQALFVRNAAGDWWHPINKVLQIASANSSQSSPLATISGATSGKFSIPAGAPKIPANLARAGWFVWFMANIRRVNANGSATISANLGTSGSASDDPLNTVSTTTGFMTLWFDVDAGFYSATGRFREGAQPTSGTDARLTGVSSWDYTTNVNTAADQYLSFNVASANAADAFYLQSFRFGVRAP